MDELNAEIFRKYIWDYCRNTRGERIGSVILWSSDRAMLMRTGVYEGDRETRLLNLSWPANKYLERLTRSNEMVALALATRGVTIHPALANKRPKACEVLHHSSYVYNGVGRFTGRRFCKSLLREMIAYAEKRADQFEAEDDEFIRRYESAPKVLKEVNEVLKQSFPDTPLLKKLRVRRTVAVPLADGRTAAFKVKVTRLGAVRLEVQDQTNFAPDEAFRILSALAEIRKPADTD